MGALTYLDLASNELEGEGEALEKNIYPYHERLHFIEFVGWS